MSGLLGTGLVLQNNDGDDLAVSVNGSFAFPTPLPLRANYAVTVKTQPNDPNQLCGVANGAGEIAGNVTNVAISCKTIKYTVGGTVTNLTGTGLVLQNNGADDLAISSDGPFAFATPQDDGTAYSITVKSQPSGQFCYFANGSGNVAGGNMTALFITCQKFVVSGTVKGLEGSGLMLSLDTPTLAPLPVSIKANGPFAFGPIIDGASYEVRVTNNPTAKVQTCTVSNGSGVIQGADVASVVVTCTTTNLPVHGRVKRLASSGLILTINDGEEVSPPSGATEFTFPTALQSGTSYKVTIKQQPSEGICYLRGASGDLMAGPGYVGVDCGPSNCVFVPGILNDMWWCKDNQKGRGCNAFCSSLAGFGIPKVSDAAWLAAQSSPAWCEILGTALGYSNLTLSNGSYSCAEGVEADNRLICSYNSQCPANHRNTTSSSNVAVCPCE